LTAGCATDDDGDHMIRHHFTVDVEEYFHPTAVASNYPMSGWEALERRSPRVVARLLDFLSEHDVKATFFIVGWLAERERAMVESIARAGHEIASHGYEHELVGALGPDGFRDSVRRSKAALEDIVGSDVVGYRAPSFSIVPTLEWAFDVLMEEGYRYDASLFPVSQHPTYGYPGAERDAHWLERPAGRLAEFPATTLRVLGTTLPASGGAYFRLLPYGLVRAALHQASERQAPGMFYIHPWELDDWAPALDLPRLQRVRTFAGRKRCWTRLTRLVDEFRFQRIDVTLGAMVGA
jgi:polysaccharide deacetylase family protein (PEP-CTERM system associated)